jgi:glycosyltransferase involved in cell wall biosynthesis
MDTATLTSGIVVIGRNEGERLRVCLTSCAAMRMPVVYVDSGSTDDSLRIAAGLGARVVSLDMTIPFTAARARNRGLAELLEAHPGLDLVQFLDGDCQLDPGWIAAGRVFLETHPGVAGVAGRLRERFPERSIYNRLCDIEWGAVVGECKAFGGIALVRCAALAAVGGFRESLIAGEEPELCVRLRAAGWAIWRMDAPMALHDAAMTRWIQWWRRAKRTGYAYAEGASLHGATAERHYVVEVRRAIAWGLVLPLAVVLLALAWPVMACLFLLYLLQWLRLGLRMSRHGQPIPWTQAAFFLQARFAEVSGALRFWRERMQGRAGRLIEYK